MKDSLKPLVLLLIAIVCLGGILNGQRYAVNAESGITVKNLTFHNYSLIQKGDNGSFYAYDGADTNGPKLATGFQVTIDSQTKDQATYLGIQWTYWSGIVIWAYSLETDVHVQGNVQITVYMSSSDSISGLLSGGGYGMGLSDVDQYGNEIKTFTVESPLSMGANPFTSTPKAYTLSVQVDYIFPKGHAIAFFAGAGATKQGYKFTVYFDSPDKNSGATLPILAQMPTPSPNPSPSASPQPSSNPSPSSSPSSFPSSVPSSSPSPFPSPSASSSIGSSLPSSAPDQTESPYPSSSSSTTFPSPSSFSSSPSPSVTSTSPTPFVSPSIALFSEASKIYDLVLLATGVAMIMLASAFLLKRRVK